MTVQQLKIEKSFPIKNPQPIRNILVIGCGGTGSYLIPNLIRLLAHTFNKVPVCLTIADADKVEEKNLIRQNFVKGDIGRNKAEALAKRYSQAFGMQIQCLPKYLETPEDIFAALSKASLNGIPLGNEAPLVISCVDNIKSRANMVSAIESTYNQKAYLLDCGNEEEGGQVLLTAFYHLNKKLSVGQYPTPNLFQLFPELRERAKKDKLASELSCADLAESSNQFGFVNLTAATIALNMIYDLMAGNPITSFMVEFSIKNKFSHRSLVQSQIESWKKLDARFSKISDYIDQ